MAGNSTPHNAAIPGDIAKAVLMPGDPLRAEFIAKNYLDNAKCFNTVRNMLGFTGEYKGKKISVMGSGMGMPSIGIYSYELYNFYDVESIIRIGSAGAIQEDLELMDIVIAQGACTDSNYANQYNLPGTYAPICSFELLKKAVDVAEAKKYPYKVGNVLSSDIFYNADESVNGRWAKMGILAIDMESAALYMNAAYAKKKALGMFTVSDQLCTDKHLSAADRQIGFSQMMELALEIG